MDKEINPAVSLKDHDNCIFENSPYYWGDLSDDEACAFLECFPRDKSRLLIRASSKNNSIAATILSPGNIEHVRISKKHNGREYLFTLDSVPTDFTFHELVFYFGKLEYSVLSRSVKDLKTTKITSETFSSIQDHPYIWDCSLEEAKKLLNNKLNFALKYHMGFLRMPEENCLTAVIRRLDGTLFEHKIVYSCDDKGHYRFSIKSKYNKSIISDLTHDELVAKYTEWGFNVLSKKDALIDENESMMTEIQDNLRSMESFLASAPLSNPLPPTTMNFYNQESQSQSPPPPQLFFQQQSGPQGYNPPLLFFPYASQRSSTALPQNSNSSGVGMSPNNSNPNEPNLPRPGFGPPGGF